MQTKLLDTLLNTPQGQQADHILRSCVHCGFCTATCPTYQLLGDELDSPRGRIYLIKQVLEGAQVTEKTRSHLDRCLTCRSCETTCPSGVQYGHLIDIGREIVEKKLPRKMSDKLSRIALRKIIPYPERFAFLLHTGQIFKPVLPAFLKNKMPDIQPAGNWPDKIHPRKMLILAGCVQQTTHAQINVSTANVLNKLGISLLQLQEVKCCGAVSQHLSAAEEALKTIKHNIDSWWPHIDSTQSENNIEAIVITASGCGVMIKDYAHLLKYDKAYAKKAKRITELTKDISEVLSSEKLPKNNHNEISKTVSFHSPCTLQHGLQLNGVVESILTRAGYKLAVINDSHLCCGSAGTYSILQPKLAKQLLSNKISALETPEPDIITTANIGCQMHLSSVSKQPVKHWIELIEKIIC